MKKIFTISVLSLFIFASAFAGDDGELNLSKKSKPVKDCFEPINRVTFALNMGLDKVIFKYKGALYPAKDSRMNNKMFNHSFPNFQQFLKFKDPKMNSKFFERIVE